MASWLMRMAGFLPYHDRPSERDAVWRGDQARQPIPHLVTQGRIERELAGIWARGGTIHLPLRVDRAVGEISTTGHRIASDHSGDRAGRSPQLPRVRTNTGAPRALQSYFLTFCEEKATVLRERCRWCGMCRRHSARTPKPSGSDRSRDTCFNGGFLTG